MREGITDALFHPLFVTAKPIFLEPLSSLNKRNREVVVTGLHLHRKISILGHLKNLINHAKNLIRLHADTSIYCGLP